MVRRGDDDDEATGSSTTTSGSLDDDRTEDAWLETAGGGKFTTGLEVALDTATREDTALDAEAA